MTRMISDLPRDLVEEILTRVPLKSMRAVRLTCKNWNALFKSRSFTTMNIGREEEAAKELGQSRMIMLMDYNLHLMSIVVNEKYPSTKCLGKLTCLHDSEQIKIAQVFHCEGLLLCILKDDNPKVVVWNPYLGQIRWIQTRYSYPEPERWDRYWLTYAIGYEKKKEKSCRSHKILTFIGDSRLKTRSQFVRYEIYDFDSDLWTTLDVSPNWRIPRDHLGVSLKGNTYWCAAIRNCYGLIDHIICFDFTSERFGPRLPLPFRARENDFLTLFCVREEKLAVLFESSDTCMIEVWITTKIEATKMSWSKFLTVDMEILTELRMSGTGFFIDEEKKICMFFDKDMLEKIFIVGEDGYFRELDLGEPTNNSFWELVCSYVPSLVQIKKPE